MKRSSKLKILVSLILGILVIQSVFIFNLNTKLSNLINTIGQSPADISLQIDSIQSDIQTTLYEHLNKSYLTERIEFKLNDIKDNELVLDVITELKKSSKDSKVYLAYKDENDNTWEEIELTQDDTLTYSGTLNYSTESNYEYKIITKGDTSESSSIEVLDKYQFIPQPPYINYVETIGEEDTLALSAHLLSDPYDDYPSSSYFDDNDIKIKNIEMILKTGSIEKTYNCKYRYSESEHYDEYEESLGVFKEEWYDTEIPKADYKANGIDSIHMKVYYSNGLIDTKNITDQIEPNYIN